MEVSGPMFIFFKFFRNVHQFNIFECSFAPLVIDTAISG